jgi:hypothetical protein
MDATTAVALSVAIDRAVPPALEAAMEVERLKAALQVSVGEHKAFVLLQRNMFNRRLTLISEALDRWERGAEPGLVIWDLVNIAITASPPPPVPW